MTHSYVILAVIFGVLRNIPEVQCAIQCYRCLVAPPTYYINDSTLLCKDFDYSDKFIVNCPFSTLCMKKISSAKIPVPINGTERGCASQRRETQEHTNGQWHKQVYIEEPYEEGCSFVNDKGARTSKTEECYCRGDLCNKSEKLYRMNLVFLLATVLITSKICN